MSEAAWLATGNATDSNGKVFICILIYLAMRKKWVKDNRYQWLRQNKQRERSALLNAEVIKGMDAP